MDSMLTQTTSRSKIVIALILLCTGHFFLDFMLGIWPVYKMMMQFDLAKAGLIVAVGAFIGEGSQLIFGTLSDKGYRKHLILFGITAAASSAFLAFSKDYTLLFGLYLATCLGSGAFHPTAAGLVNSLVPAKRGLFMSIFAAAGSLGLASSQLIFSYTFEKMDGNTAVLIIPSVCLVLGCLFYTFPRLKQQEGAGHGKVSLKDFVTFFKRDDLRCLYISQVANQTLLWGMIFMLPNVLHTLGHLEWVCFGGGHMCLILGCACMVIPAGYLADRYSARSVMIYATWIAGISFYLILMSGGFSMFLVLPLLFILGASMGLVNPIAVSLGNRLVPEKPGTISAFLMGLVWCVSEAMGPGGAGWLSTFFTDYAPVKAMAVLGCFFWLGIYATYRLPKIASEFVRVKA